MELTIEIIWAATKIPIDHRSVGLHKRLQIPKSGYWFKYQLRVTASRIQTRLHSAAQIQETRSDNVYDSLSMYSITMVEK